MEYLSNLYILALELEFANEATDDIYAEIKALEKELQLDVLAAWFSQTLYRFGYHGI